MLVNGKVDGMLYQRHLIPMGGLSFAELKRSNQINKRARDGDPGPRFLSLNPRRVAAKKIAGNVSIESE